SEENYVDEAQAEGEVISEESIEENQGLKEINDVKKDKEVETEVQSSKKTDVPTLEEILELGKNEYTASGKRKIYMEGYELYPESQEIKERLESTAKSLFELGKKQHRNENTLKVAISYYNDILTMPAISQGTIGLAERYRDVANKGIVYRSLEEILELGKNEYTASGKRKIYMEGYELYPESQEIKERLESTAKSLLALGRNHYEKGNFNSAINYYNDILTMPAISQETIGITEQYKNLADKEIVYRSLEEILELGKNEYTASGKRKIYMEGYELYPESEEIKERLENTAKALLNLGKNHHSKGNFNSAINYYNDILTMPGVSQGTIGITEKYRGLANEGTILKTLEEILELGKNEYTASGKRKIYMEGYELYPESPEIKERLENTAKGLLNLGRTYHSKGNFN
ncbi:tetratricopeptide repeat protein, partial [Senegalia massiliensis]